MEIKLFNKEELNKSTEVPQYLSDEQINDKYTNSEIRIITEQGRYPLEEVAKMFLNKGKYNDVTDYQRNYVWSNKSRSLLIESFIMNIPIPPIFLYERDYSFYEILDGKQRISSIVKFYNNEYALEGLEVWSELNGKRYYDLPIRIKEGLDRRYLSSIIMLKESFKDSFEVNKLKKMVFERLNTGGEKLYPQESRNAIFGGPFNELCKELVFAFRQLKKFEGNLNTFLDIYLDNANKYDSCLQEQLRMLFVSTIKFAFELFDGHPFKLYSQKNNKIRSTKYAVRTIYDPFMQVLSQYLNHKQTILTHKGQIQEDYINMLLENEEEFSGKYQHKATIEERIALFDQFLSKYTN